MSNDLATLTKRLESGQRDERREAATALMRLGESARPAACILAANAGDEDESIREAVTGALEDLGPPMPDHVSQLAQLLNHECAEVGYWAATLLGRLKSSAAAATDSLAAAILDSDKPAVRQRAAWALGQIGPAAQGALPALETAARSSDVRLARLASQALDAVRN